MKLQTAYIKLTIYYVLIILFISITFSIILYKISTIELGRGFDRQITILRDLPFAENGPKPMPDFEKVRIEQLKESNDKLKLNLIYFNLLILVLSSSASYFLAKNTLKPVKEMMEAQNRFTADASHELRTPLTAMRTGIEVNLRDEKLDLSSAKKLLKSNIEEIDRLDTLSNALLKLARHQEGEKKHFKKVSLEQIAVEAYEKVESLAREKSIEFKNKIENLHILGDKQNLVELFVIILENAIKYSPEKSQISIDICKENNFAYIKIKDNGIGIKASDLPHIFERFYRADHSRSKIKTDGYGLGLAIAKNIVDAHHGTIKVESSPAKGSVFIIIIPIK